MLTMNDEDGYPIDTAVRNYLRSPPAPATPCPTHGTAYIAACGACVAAFVAAYPWRNEGTQLTAQVAVVMAVVNKMLTSGYTVVSVAECHIELDEEPLAPAAQTVSDILNLIYGYMGGCAGCVYVVRDGGPQSVDLWLLSDDEPSVSSEDSELQAHIDCIYSTLDVVVGK